MSPAKIRLSAQELEMVTNAALILTKNRIMEKALQLLGQVQQRQESFLKSYAGKLPDEVISSTPKISRGEQLQGLPYLVLDYPRVFTQDHFFAIRSLFWWGKFFSITLHLSGRYQALFKRAIADAYPHWSEKGWHLAGGGDPWQHDFRHNYYMPFAMLDAAQLQQHLSGPFLKLALYWPLSEWDNAADHFDRAFRDLLTGLTGKFDV